MEAKGQKIQIHVVSDPVVKLPQIVKETVPPERESNATHFPHIRSKSLSSRRSFSLIGQSTNVYKYKVRF